MVGPFASLFYPMAPCSFDNQVFVSKYLLELPKEEDLRRLIEK